MNDRVHVSVVSHGQASLVLPLLRDMERFCHDRAVRVTLTLNIPEPLPFPPEGFPFPVDVLRNAAPKGFGANHNAAFKHQSEDAFFCVLNPDIRLTADPFGPLIEALKADPACGLAAPVVRSPQGDIEDSARALPTPFTILTKAAGHVEATYTGDRPDWVAGMFMLFPAATYAAAGGFDERYHLYYEDVDLCCRLRLARRAICLTRTAEVIHAARRESRRNPRYLRWHLGSMARFFLSRVFLKCWLGRP